jgi:hypothetical protein
MYANVALHYNGHDRTSRVNMLQMLRCIITDMTVLHV